MRFVVFILVLFISIKSYAWPPSYKAIDLNVTVLGEIVWEVPNKFVGMNEQKRKTEFIKWILPIIERQNNIVEQQRDILLQIKKRESLGIALRPEAEEFLAKMQLIYGGNSLRELLQRVNTIPVALVIAQASLESGWGSSRFAQQGNNLFGIRTYNKKDIGIKPKDNLKANFKVKAYRTVDDSIADYLLLLNSHHAYSNLRTTRAFMTIFNLNDVHVLADTLFNYSELGSEYIKMVHEHITTIERILNEVQ
jgi:Bax protein